MSVAEQFGNPAKAPIVYQSAFEVPEEDEAETSRSLTETMRGITDTTYKDGGKPLRSVHAKAHGILHGRLTVLPGLPPHLAQGLFAQPGNYPVAMRFSTTPGDIMDDSVSTPRGLAIKAIGVKGARVQGSEGDETQDFVLANGPAFHSASGKAFLRSLKLLAATTDTPQVWKKVASAVLRGTEAFIEAFGGKSATIMSMGGHPQTNILGETFFSQVPVLYGDYVAKIQAAPVSPELAELKDAPVDLDGRPDGIREAVSEFFAQYAGVWELRVQLCTDLKAMPIEDPTAVWPEDQSPYVTVARIEVEPQASWDAGRQIEDEALSFSPWHALAAHRPLGRIMRARKNAYETIARIRRERGERMLGEPRSLEEIGRA
jgi:hypothetical protein